MSSLSFVIDEWLLHDLAGQNGKDAQEEAGNFLRKLKEKCDKIVVLRGSPWAQKAYGLMTQPDPLISKLSKYLHVAILLNSQKCRLLSSDDLRELPDNLKNLVPADDLYLVEIFDSANAKALVTTDKTLYQSLSTAQIINIRLRDDFLKEYLA
ncbi:MAG: hypothetical protein ACREQA_08300 [Candidatus Binatia bacterium]